MALDTLKVLPAVDGLPRVRDVTPDLLVAAGRDEVAHDVGAEPVTGLVGVFGLADNLGPNVCEDLGVPDKGTADVDLIAGLKVHLLLNGDFTLLVVLNGGLKRRWVNVKQVHLR